MLTVSRLRRKPKHFHSFTGLSVAEFDGLLAAFEPAYAEAERLKHDRPDRLRAIGGGRTFTLTVENRLLLGLVHLRLYCIQSLLGYLFGIDESNIGRELNHRSLPLLQSLLPVPMRDWLLIESPSPEKGLSEPEASSTAAPPKRKKIKTLEELLRRYPELNELNDLDGAELGEVFIDATEQPVPRPKAKQPRRERYSGKQKQHTVKTQVVTTRRGLILHAFGSLPGSVHDTTVLKASGVLRTTSLAEPPLGSALAGPAVAGRIDACPAHTVIVRLDKGYEGIEEMYPTVRFAKPIKRPRNHRTTALGRAYNRWQSSLRMPVEHAIGSLKHFRVLSDIWRGRFEAHEQTFSLVSGLINYRLLGRLSF